MFSLKFDPKEILIWAERYPVSNDQKVESIIAPRIKVRGFYDKLDFVTICRWKTPRSIHLVESNPKELVEAVTKIALSTPVERLRIEILTLLTGVSWPTASVLLHFGYSNLYPILDFRALWSLGIDFTKIRYDFDFWWSYTRFCRKLASDTGVTMRVLDRALWQYSDSNQ